MAKKMSPDVPFLLLSENGDDGKKEMPPNTGIGESRLKHRLHHLSSTVLRAHHEANEHRERRKNEDQIRQQAELLDRARDAIFVRNLDQEIIYWNKSAERIYGWTGAEVIGKRASEILYKQNAPPRDNIWKTVLEKGEWIGEIAQSTKAGHEIFVTSRRTLLRDGIGVGNAVLNINTDITEKREMETVIQRAQRMDSLGALAGGMAHDLNNVLAPILMATEMLGDQLKQPEDLAMLKIAETSAKRGIDLVKQILQFAQGTKGQGTMKVKSVMDDFVNLIRKTFPRTLDFDTDIPVDLMPITCDPTQLHQIVLNLCVNARDAMPNGGNLSIKVCNTILSNRTFTGNPEPVSGSFVELTVSDSGTGIPPEVLSRIFEPFFTTKQPGKGTGIGLSTVTTILRNLNGLLDVSTVVGKGTTFRVYLPSINQIGPAESRIIPSASDLGSGEWILLVDGELALLEMTQGLLEAHNYNVLTAIGAEEALVCLKKYEDKISVVITDLTMPGMSGSDLIATIRETLPRVITICLSGSADMALQISTDIRPHAFLQKPCSTKEMLALLKKLLADQEARYLGFAPPVKT
jgi:PAS domain S-box-containing protein